ncbi:DUF4389 domain-containing protein [Temperatibacter marinus]|uniref:DUF4389 domain-containing protein n=1 Tax=Temperatibacter marinus TaxID=1456591 RepID=A0AA52ECL5_9PROT|nr:DUF4389 domain-containing protein [Temperatibacter marinus]WND02296.1 DUF4389 domain-containing protein [Temperatibacter marinus]
MSEEKKEDKPKPKTKAAPKKRAKKSPPKSEKIIDVEAKTVETPTETKPEEEISQAAKESTKQDTGSSSAYTSSKNTHDFSAKDHASQAKEKVNEAFDKVKGHIPERDWGKHLYDLAMLAIFGFLGMFAAHIFIIVAVVNWVYELGFQQKNETLSTITSILGNYIKDVVDLFTGNADDLPFPLGKEIPKASHTE